MQLSFLVARGRFSCKPAGGAASKPTAVDKKGVIETSKEAAEDWMEANADWPDPEKPIGGEVGRPP